MYDVIIIGAGPTGSTAAKILSEKGYRVLLSEKCKMPACTQAYYKGKGKKDENL